MIYFQHERIVVRITELLARGDAADGFGVTVVDVFEIAATCHVMLGVPCLSIRRRVDPSFVVIHTNAFSIVFNDLHVDIDPNSKPWLPSDSRTGRKNRGFS